MLTLDQFVAPPAPLEIPEPSVTYTVPGFRVKLGKPRAVVTSSGPSDFAWFAGMHRFPSGPILMRWSFNNDGANNGVTKNIISFDNGKTFDPASLYSNTGKPSPLEPMVMEDNGTFHGGEFWQWSWVDASRRKVSCGYQTFTNVGRAYSYIANGVVISGFPVDIGESFGAGFPALSWTDRIIKVSDTEWYSTIQPVTTLEAAQVYTYAIKSVDKGRTWVVVGQLNGHITTGQEGYSEVCTIKDGSRFISISRTGVAPISRCYSDDNMATWTPTGGPGHGPTGVDQDIGAWFKSPWFDKLSCGAYVLLTGRVPQYLIDDGQARAVMGLYVTGDVMSGTWPVIDLKDHHNRMLDSSLAFDDTSNVSTGYMSMAPLPSTPTVTNALISYDQAGGSYGISSRPNRIFVADAQFQRI